MSNIFNPQVTIYYCLFSLLLLKYLPSNCIVGLLIPLPCFGVFDFSFRHPQIISVTVFRVFQMLLILSVSSYSLNILFISFFVFLFTGNVILIVIGCLVKDYCLGGSSDTCSLNLGLTPVNYQQVIFILEIFCAIPFVIKHIGMSFCFHVFKYCVIHKSCMICFVLL